MYFLNFTTMTGTQNCTTKTILSSIIRNWSPTLEIIFVFYNFVWLGHYKINQIGSGRQFLNRKILDNSTKIISAYIRTSFWLKLYISGQKPHKNWFQNRTHFWPITAHFLNLTSLLKIILKYVNSWTYNIQYVSTLLWATPILVRLHSTTWFTKSKIPTPLFFSRNSKINYML